MLLNQRRSFKQRYRINVYVPKRERHIPKPIHFQDQTDRATNIQVIILLDALSFSLSVCTISFFGKILEHEIFQLKVGTLRMDPEWTRFWRKSKLGIKHEPRTQTTCLKVLITLFFRD